MTKMIDGMSNMPGKPNWKKRNGPLVALVFKVRQKTGMTLSELARTLGVCHQEMSDIATGRILNPPKRVNGIKKYARIEKRLREIFETGTAYGMNHYFDSKKVTGCSAQDCPICKFLEFQSKLQK